VYLSALSRLLWSSSAYTGIDYFSTTAAAAATTTTAAAVATAAATTVVYVSNQHMRYIAQFDKISLAFSLLLWSSSAYKCINCNKCVPRQQQQKQQQ
jgi:hypothetical protein